MDTATQMLSSQRPSPIPERGNLATKSFFEIVQQLQRFRFVTNFEGPCSVAAQSVRNSPQGFPLPKQQQQLHRYRGFLKILKSLSDRLVQRLQTNVPNDSGAAGPASIFRYSKFKCQKGEMHHFAFSVFILTICQLDSGCPASSQAALDRPESAARPCGPAPG